jgi:mannonate dehydratase
MKLGMMLPARECLQWKIAAQLGVKYAITKAAPEITGLSDPSDYSSLKAVRSAFAENGLELYGLEGDEFDMSRIKLGLDGRDEDIEKYKKMLKNMGALGIKMLCYNFMAGVGWYRTDTDIAERGGAMACGFNVGKAEKTNLKITAEKMWENYEYFLRAVMPAAEAAGVVMCMHPDDPPIPELCGYSRIMINAGAYRRAMGISDSPSHKITFCQSCFKLAGDDVFGLIKEFGGRIHFLHFRDVIGEAYNFRETFHDNGTTDMVKLMKYAQKYAPECIVRADHTPTMAGEEGSETGYAVLGNVFAAGYIRGIAEALKIELE